MNKNLLITGASRGIGASCAEQAAKAGWNVCINYVNNRDAAEQVARTVEQAGSNATVVQGDVRQADDVERIFEHCSEQLGSLDGLVNNAGIVGRASSLADSAIETITSVIDINVKGALLCAREATRRMSSGGVIVNMSSAAATLGSPNEYVWYAASKAAIDTLTDGLAKECGPKGIRVNAVSPGLIETEIHDSSGVENRLEKLVGGVPLGRCGQPQEVADAVVWLLSDQASYVSGAIVRIGGGR